MTIHDVLGQMFPGEWHALSAYDRSAIIVDAIDAAEHGCDAAEYKRRIGAGNLQSYADALNAPQGAK
jgi:hypothetical protein